MKIIHSPPLPPMDKELNGPTVSHACRMRQLKGNWSRRQRVYGVGQHLPPVLPLQSTVGETVDVVSKCCNFSHTSHAQSPSHSMVQHLADWGAPFPLSQHPNPPPHLPFKFLYSPSSPQPSPYMHQNRQS